MDTPAEPTIRGSTRVLILINNLGGGGAERVVLTLASAMISLEARVTIVTLEGTVAFPVDPSIEYYCLDESQYPRRGRLRRVGAALRQLVARLEQEDGEFHLTLAHLKRSTDVAIRAGLTNCFHCVHNTTSLEEFGDLRGMRRIAKRRRIQAVYRGRNVITVSKGIADDLVGNVGARVESIRTIYNPIEPRWTQEQSRAPNQFADRRYIVHVGRFVREKRHDRLLRAFARARTSHELVLLGEGELLEQTKALADELGLADRVVFAGFQANPYPVIAGADALVLSSDREGLAMVLLEAVALGVIPVSVDCPSGPSEFMDGPLERFLVHVDEDQLARALEDVLGAADEDWSQVLADALTRFDAGTAASSYLALARRR